MSGLEFRRYMPEAHEDLRRAPGLWSFTHLDGWLLLFLLILCGFGLFVLYSASGQDMGYVYRQAVRMALGFGLMVAMARVSPRTYARWSPALYGLTLLMLIGVLVIGVGAKGAQRWLDLGVTRFQPSELMKLALPLTVAFYLSSRTLPPKPRDIVIALVLVAVPTALIMKQPDLGTSLLIAASGLFVILLSGLRWRYVFGALAAAGALLPVLWEGMHDYQRRRVMTFLNPESDPLGSGWNIIQSKTAIGSGGIEGKGWATGTQSQLDFLPESHTDFIIAVIAEELGLVGVLALLLLYTLIIGRCLMIAATAKDCFARLIAGSVSLTFFVYVFVNMGMVSGILPVVGVPLPLVSYGGTSMVTLMLGFGLMMSVYSHRGMMRR